MHNATSLRKLFLGAALAALFVSGAPTAVQAKKAAAAEWPVVTSPVKRDDAMEARIAQIIAGMTLRQKIGQMTQPDIRSITPDEVRQYYIGSILNGGGAWPEGKKQAAVSDWVALADAYYKASMATDMAVNVPVIWGTDAVHGHNNVFKTTLFPHHIGLGAAHDPKMIREIAHLTYRKRNWLE